LTSGFNHLGWSTLEIIGGYILITCLIIGPVLIGSYIGAWRWPLVVCSAIAATLLLLASLLKKPTNWKLLALLLLPVIQGLWMWYNAWGESLMPTVSEHGQLPWRISELSDQPASALPGAVDRTEAMDRLSYIIPCLGLIWGTRHLAIKRPAWCKKIAITIFWTGVFVAFLGLLQRGTEAHGIYWSMDMEINRSHLFFGTYRSPGIAACFLNIALAFGLSSTLSIFGREQWAKHESNNRRILHLLGTTIGTIIITSAVIVAGSKTGMLLAILTIIFWGILNRNPLTRAFHQSAQLFKRDRRLERNIVLTTLVFILVISTLSFAGNMLGRGQPLQEHGFASTSGRMTANQVQMKMIADDDWGIMGYGPGSFPPPFPHHTGEHGDELGGVWAYAHNDYLQTLVEWGWLGTLCFTAVIGGGFFLLIREVLFNRSGHSKMRLIYFRGYLLGMLTLLVHATVEFPLQIESIAVIFSVMLGVAWASVDLRKQDKGSRSRPEKGKQGDQARGGEVNRGMI